MFLSIVEAATHCTWMSRMFYRFDIDSFHVANTSIPNTLVYESLLSDPIYLEVNLRAQKKRLLF